jgi:hypothetical protein
MKDEGPGTPMKFSATHILPGVRVVLTVNHPDSRLENGVNVEVFVGDERIAQVEVGAESLDRTDRGLQDVLNLLPGFKGPIRLAGDNEE